MARALTRNITKAQARSYKRSIPNGLGVTTIASVNGRGAYAKAYKATRKMLGGSMAKKGTHRARKNPGRGTVGYTAAYGASPFWQRGAAASGKGKGGASPRLSTPGAASTPAAVAAATGGRFIPTGTGASIAGGKAGGGWTTPGYGSMRGPYALKLSVLRKAGYKPAQIRKLMGAKAYDSAIKRGKSAHAAAGKRSKAKIGKSYGKFKSLVGTIGGNRVATYVAKGKKGRVKKIPIWAIAGFKGPREYVSKTRTGSPTFDPAAKKRVDAIWSKRRTSATRMFKHGGIFTPNEGGDVLTYKEWSQMTPNGKRKGRKHSKRRYTENKGTRKQRAAAMRNLRKARVALRHKSGGRKKYRANHSKAGGYRHHKLGGTALKKHLRHGLNELKAYASRGPKSRRGVSRKRALKDVRELSKYAPNEVYAENRRRSRRGKKRYHRNEGAATFEANGRRRRAKRHTTRRSYRRNPDMMAMLQETAKSAAGVVGGLIVHKVLTHVVSEQLLSKVSMFNTGAVANWKDVISGGLVGVIGVIGVGQLNFGLKKEVQAGMIASFFHSLILSIAKQTAPTVAGYLGEYGGGAGSAYRGAGRAYGEYVMSGMGAYELQPTHGFGEYVMSGFGAAPVFEASAGFGADVTQASAGYGQLLTEASAGVGEYVMSGIQGIGDYELSGDLNQAQAGYGVYDGIRPDLASAERSLNIAEAQAGIGDLPVSSTRQPMMAEQPVEDAQRGSRAGILQGQDGIFDGF